MTEQSPSTCLKDKTCAACSGGAAPLKGEELKKFAEQIDDAWNVVDEHHLKREFKFNDFAAALKFVNRVGEVAEQENHHPEITFTYGKATIRLHTHKIDGLSEADFILAAKIDELRI